MAKTPIKPRVDDESALKLTGGTLMHGLQRIDDYVRNPDSSDLGSDSADLLARLLTRVAQIAGELRKAETAARNAESELTAPQMLERIRRMTTAERLQFTRSVQSLNADAGKSGLA